MDSGCHRARVSIILTGEQNVSRAGFSTMKATRIASAITPLSQFIRIGAICCGWALKMGDLISSIFGKSSSVLIGIAPPIPIASPPGRSPRFMKSPAIFYG